MRRRRRLVYILITVWSALGFPLAFRKCDFGTKVAWIGAKLTAHDDKGVVRAKEDILDELSQDIEEATARNFTTKAVLRSLAQSVARSDPLQGLAPPSLSKLWAAIASVNPTLPPQSVLVRQFEATTRWLTAFRRGKRGTFKRTFDPEAYQNRGERLCRWRRTSSSTSPRHSRRPT